MSHFTNLVFLIFKIKEVKEKIQAEKGSDYLVENQKLILLGKVLEDAKTVGEYSINENSSIVCFASKAKPAAAPAPAAPAAPPATTSASTPAAESTPAPTVVPTAQPTTTPTPATPAAPASSNPTGGDSGMVQLGLMSRKLNT